MPNQTHVGGFTSPRSSNTGVVHTNIRVFPKVATFFRKTLRRSTIQEKLKFDISQSQVYTDGKCEILGIKLDANIPNSVIIDYVSSLMSGSDFNLEGQADVDKCLQDINLSTSNPSYNTTNLNEKPATIDDSIIGLSDADDSVCILSSPITLGVRKPCLKDASSIEFSDEGCLNSSCVVIESTVSSPEQSSNIRPLTPSSPKVVEESCEANLSVIVLDSADNSSLHVHSSCSGSNEKKIEHSSLLQSLPKPKSVKSTEILQGNSDSREANLLLEEVANTVKSLINIEKLSKYNTGTPIEQEKTMGSTLNKAVGLGINVLRSRPHLPTAVNADDSSDDVVIEKELPRNPPSSAYSRLNSIVKAVTIEDSDDEDDILVCEVKSSNDRKRKTFSSSPDFIPITSNERKKRKITPAPDFIPLTSNERKKRKITSAPDFIPLTNRPGQNKLKEGPFSHRQKKQQLKKHKVKNVLGISPNNGVKTKSNQLVPKGKKGIRKEALRTGAHISGKVEAVRKSDDSNIVNPNSNDQQKSVLRPVIIDANNVAAQHGHGEFSPLGLKICIKYFQDRGHKVVAILPKFRRFHISEEDRNALDALEKKGVVSYTPSRTMPDGRKVASYDDRFIVQAACELGGVIVSTDNYRDLLAENERWRETIEERLLMFTWVGDILMFPEDPLGRHGPTLKEFLCFPSSENSK